MTATGPRSVLAATEAAFADFPDQAFDIQPFPGAESLPFDAGRGKRRFPGSLELAVLASRVDVALGQLTSASGLSPARVAQTVDHFSATARLMVAAVHAQVALEDAHATGTETSALETALASAVQAAVTARDACVAEAAGYISSANAHLEKQAPGRESTERTVASPARSPRRIPRTAAATGAGRDPVTP